MLLKDQAKKKYLYKIFLSITLGWVGFALNFFPLTFYLPPQKASFMLGLVFPVVITLAWGWKYGLLSATIGLACQNGWWLWGKANGYAIFLAVPPFTLWIIWHGIFADIRKRMKEKKWYLNIYLLEIPIRIFSTIIIYIANWAFRFNPPPWSPEAPKELSLYFSNFVAIKQLINGFIVLLLVDILLNIGVVRKFLKIQKKPFQSNTSFIINISLLIGLFFWVIDSFIDFIFFSVEGTTFLDAFLFKINPQEFYMRCFFILAFLIGGLAFSKLLQNQMRTEKKYQQLLETLNEGFAIFDPNGKALHINDSFSKMLGYSKKKILSKDLSSFFDAKNKKILLKQLAKRKRGEKSTYEIEFTGNKKKKIPTLITASPIYNDHGVYNGSFTLVTDISKIKKAEEDLKFRSMLLDQIQDKIIATDPNGKITYINQAEINSFNMQRNEIIGKNITEYGENARRGITSYTIMTNTLRDGSWEGRIVNYTKDGTEIIFDTRTWVIKDEDGNSKGMISVSNDITDNVKIEKEKEDLVKSLRFKNEELESLLYISSHDLRSPLVNVQGFSNEIKTAFEDIKDLLKKENVYEKLKSKIEPIFKNDLYISLEYIQTSVVKMDQLLNGLLKISRLSRSAMEKKELDMNMIVKNILKSFQFKIQEKRIKIELKNLHSCFGDEIQIDQLFTNLIDNSIKYLAPKRKGEIFIYSKKNKDELTYYIEDNGIGIIKEEQGRIFDIFKRVYTDKKIPGEGLGLTIVKKITERHNGRIRIKSSEGKGSKFCISFPIRNAALI